MPSSVTAAAAKSLQLCPTLCDPIDGSPHIPKLGLLLGTQDQGGFPAIYHGSVGKNECVVNAEVIRDLIYFPSIY